MNMKVLATRLIDRPFSCYYSNNNQQRLSQLSRQSRANNNCSIGKLRDEQLSRVMVKVVKVIDHFIYIFF